MMINEDELKERIANNLINYRKINQLTQLELAEKLNYTDKSISKWERKEGLPDITILVKLANLYGITVNDFLAEEVKPVQPRKRISHLLITLIAFTGVWVIAMIVFTVFGLFHLQGYDNWMVFIYAIPASFLVLVACSFIWGTRMMKLVSTSLLLWSVVLSVYLTFNIVELWLLFVSAIPVQIIFIFWTILKNWNKNTK
jgi:transcriptional regulator with XRE-family HTH domain